MCNNYSSSGLDEATDDCTVNADGLYDLSAAALSASHNLIPIKQLQDVLLPAMMLLNGFGPITMLKTYRSVSAALDHWTEPATTTLPDLVTVLPRSIRRLSIEVDTIQWDLLRYYLWRELSTSNEAAKLPNLQEVRIFYSEDELGKTYWKRSTGFDLNWREQGLPEVPHVSCGWCRGADDTQTTNESQQ